MNSERSELLNLINKIYESKTRQELTALKERLDTELKKIENFNSDHWEPLRLAMDAYHDRLANFASQWGNRVTRLLALAGFILAGIQTVIKVIEFCNK